MKQKKKIPSNAKIVFKGKIFSVWHWDQEMFDGSIQTYEAISRNNSTSVLAITKEKKIIVNFEEQPHIGKFTSIPGGMGEDELTELENAKKELLEETGYQSNCWELWRSDDVLKHNKIDWNSTIFVARECYKNKDVKFDPGEKIESHFLDFEDFIEIVQKKEFRTKNLKEFVNEILGDKIKLQEFKEFLLGK